MMTISDICCTSKPWESHRSGVEELFKEFYLQVQQSYPVTYCYHRDSITAVVHNNILTITLKKELGFDPGSFDY